MKKYKLLINFTIPEEIYRLRKGQIVNFDKGVYTIDGYNLSKALVESNPDMFEELKPLFHTEDFEDGNFKQCNQCISNCKDLFTADSINCWDSNSPKGQAIYEGDECWGICTAYKNLNSIDFCKQEWGAEPEKLGLTGLYSDMKFFSNESNARTYYNYLHWKDKLKFKVGEVVICPEACKPAQTVITNVDFLNERYDTGVNLGIPFIYQKAWQLYTKPKSATEQAEELGFKIGDAVWYSHKDYKGGNHKYVGEVLTFTRDGEGELAATTTLMSNVDEEGTTISINLVALTNRVAIHTPTKREFEFINGKLHFDSISEDSWQYVVVNKKNACHTLDNTKHLYENTGEVLIISVDQYMKSIGKLPLFITEDGVKVYDEYNKEWFCVDTNDLKYGVYAGGENRNHYITNGLVLSDKTIKRFSTKQAAEDYIKSKEVKVEYIKVLHSRGKFYTEGEVCKVQHSIPSTRTFTVKDRNCCFYYSDCTLVNEEEYNDYIKSKEYPKIYSFRPIGSENVHSLQEDGNYKFNTSRGYSLEEYLYDDGASVKDNHFEIYQVLKSKDELLSIGDITDKGLIVKFTSFNESRQFFVDLDNDGIADNMSIGNLTKLEPKIITEEGISLYGDDKCYSISESCQYTDLGLANYKGNFSSLKHFSELKNAKIYWHELQLKKLKDD